MNFTGLLRGLLFGSLFLLTSCQLILLPIVGISEPKEEVRYSKIERFIKNNCMLKSSNYILKDSSVSLLKSLKIANDESPKRIYNYMQPLQVFVYNDSDSLIYHQANCQTGGFPNLDWNKYGNFTNLKMKKYPADSVMIKTDEMRNYSVINQGGAIEKKYTIVLIWTTFMRRQARRLIDFSREIQAVNLDIRVEVVYVNYDPLFSKVIREK